MKSGTTTVSVTLKSSGSDRLLLDIFLTTYFYSNINTERSVFHLTNILPTREVTFSEVQYTLFWKVLFRETLDQRIVWIWSFGFECKKHNFLWCFVLKKNLKYFYFMWTTSCGVFFGIWGFFIAYQSQKAVVHNSLLKIQFKLLLLFGEPRLCTWAPGAYTV